MDDRYIHRLTQRCLDGLDEVDNDLFCSNFSVRSCSMYRDNLSRSFKARALLR